MSDSSEDENLPSAAECGKRCQLFADLTGTDTALAMFYLQDRNWTVEVLNRLNSKIGVGSFRTKETISYNNTGVTSYKDFCTTCKTCNYEMI